ncbi:F-box/FBD/LRR-repeat protein At1g13570 isoform X1 [Aegilops tauschii subsp. strangulata]|uniref:F-box domain-containing protein n=3 Tax=Aegilops tauschii subsp. strangulata TaxID=200361 RepID=A0A453C781_AEGTS|nr:FBD-associated F-box protein At5g60610 isoform X1 [Aegilops tauschii subsp. strangulata]XP_040255238.1 FBD-associated F-box protein At5g60610 isoform X1 [Aegilops tauschii subsp. strangulata]XP_045089066.1 FBD-associated F-box protein At5g60610 isoform X1 [Aegilops tauschii subsp. strangulata]
MEKSVAGSADEGNVSMDKSSSCKKRCLCDWISGLPDEILVSILFKLDSKTAVGTSLLSRRWRRLWRLVESFHFSEVVLPDNYCWVRLGPMRDYFSTHRDHHFVESLQWFTRLKRETPLRRLSLVFSGSVECSDVVNSAIASAAQHGISDIDMAIFGRMEYEFPWWLLSVCRSSALTSLCLSHCKLSVPLDFGGFGSLTKLVLVQMYMSLKEVQVLLRCCTNLVSLHLIGMFDIRILRLPKLKELLLLMTPSLGKFKVDTPDLQRLEYCGEMLPTSTFQSIPCLEHVSLQFTDDIYPEYDADKLEDISTCFPHVKSLCLRYEIPKLVKPRTPATFLNLKVLTLNIATKPSDDLLWMFMFLIAAPYLATLRTTVHYLSYLESHSGVVWDDVDFQHVSLKNVEMYNFMGRDNEIGLARLLLCRAPNLRYLSFNQARLEEGDDHQLVPPTWPMAETFSPRDSQFVLSKLLENVSSSARVVFI